jgi:ribose/xylose/arabinose/galactoside ABC-type transport system permease subunit
MAITGIISVGMTIVILTGGIDLSVGAIVALVSVLIAGLQGMGIGPLIVLGLLVGGMIGVGNGLGVVAGRLQPFIMTLAMMTVARGLAFILSKGKPMEILLDALALIGSGKVLGLPIPGVIFVLALVISGWALSHLPFGRHLYAIGSNAEAARLSGVNVGGHLVGAYVLSGLCAGVAGVLFAAHQRVGMALAGTGYELNAIAAVVMGGASLFGGEGSVWNTAVGAAIIAVMGNIMNLTGVSPFAQDFLKGLIIIAAAVLRLKVA